ncbi:MAG: caspase family protein [Limnohabitans sp.]|nr:caspase family protein [Limnohabitans sp.]
MSALKRLQIIALWLFLAWFSFPALTQETAPQSRAESRTASPRKLALVIGNSQYQGVNRRLKNPAHDAQLMSQTLLKLGFEVQTHLDLSRAEMGKRVSAFAASLPTGATSLVFYAGHGVQIGGASYLMPTDIQLSSEQNVQLSAYPLRRLLDEVSAAPSAVNIVILDACRDNPFQPAAPVRYRSTGPIGLAKTRAPRGTLLAYSTQPGQLAADGKNNNSVYTAALANTLLETGLTVEEVFKKVNALVRDKTRDDQIPWYESSIIESIYFLPSTPKASSPKNSNEHKGLEQLGLEPYWRSPFQGMDLDNYEWWKSAEPDQPPDWHLNLDAYEWGKLSDYMYSREHDSKLEDIPPWLKRAENGNVIDMTSLGVLYRDGSIFYQKDKNFQLPPNHAKALYWLQRAAEKKFALAQLYLANMYQRGEGVKKDNAKARQLLNEASKTQVPDWRIQAVSRAFEND